MDSNRVVGLRLAIEGFSDGWGSRDWWPSGGTMAWMRQRHGRVRNCIGLPALARHQRRCSGGATPLPRRGSPGRRQQDGLLATEPRRTHACDGNNPPAQPNDHQMLERLRACCRGVRTATRVSAGIAPSCTPPASVPPGARLHGTLTSVSRHSARSLLRGSRRRACIAPTDRCFGNRTRARRPSADDRRRLPRVGHQRPPLRTTPIGRTVTGWFNHCGH